MYSQGEEERHILAAFKDREEPGRFLDIGAFHPTCFSNTRALVELGWSGICIEPSPGPMLNLLAEYGDTPGIVLIQAAVGFNHGFVQMSISNDAVSTSSKDEYERWKNNAKFIGSMLIPVIMLEEISNQFAGFDFWSIDTEGTSPDIFRRMIELNHKPHCVAVEHSGRTTELLDLATRDGYKCVLCNQTNMVLVR